MTDPYHSKPGPRQGSGGPTKPAPEKKPAPAAPANQAPPEGSGGRIVHDSRGNAVWQWVKDAGRVAIESTSMLLKRLEVPELEVEEHKEDKELKLEDDVDQGGGFDPYATRVGTRKPTPPPPKPPLKKK